MCDIKDKIQRIDLDALMKRAEAAQNLDRYAGPNESLTFLFLITKLREETAMAVHLAGALERIDELVRHTGVIDSKLAAVVADAAETRRLTMAAVDRVNTLAHVVGAGMDEIARVSGLAEAQGKALRVQAELDEVNARERKAELEAQRKQLATLETDVRDRD